MVRRTNDPTYDELDPAQRKRFDDYFVVRTAANARRFRDHVWPGITLVDEEAMGRVFAGWTIDIGSGTCAAPALIVAGRCDSVVGYSDATRLMQQYPHATLAVIDGAGHALMHEQPEVLSALDRRLAWSCLTSANPDRTRVETRGIEPLTPALQRRCSTN